MKIKRWRKNPDSKLVFFDRGTIGWLAQPVQSSQCNPWENGERSWPPTTDSWNRKGCCSAWDGQEPVGQSERCPTVWWRGFQDFYLDTQGHQTLERRKVPTLIHPAQKETPSSQYLFIQIFLFID